MIFNFEIKEIKRTNISVKANNPSEAQKIFSQWYEKHTAEEPQDTTIYDLLDNGYEGREITRSPGIPESDWHDKVMLPEESDEPEEPLYDLHVRFADGSASVCYGNQLLSSIGTIFASLGGKYYLIPDPEKRGLVVGEDFYVYAVLKDAKETWYELDCKEDLYFGGEKDGE